MKLLTLFHGSNMKFDCVDLSKSKNRRDFGRGFYMTTFREQAVEWAKNMKLRFKSDEAYIYTFSLKLHGDLNKKVFSDLTEEWLEMIKENRIFGSVRHDYDIVIGPVANDNTFRAITLYLEGDYTAKQVIDQLRFFRPNDQLSIHTEKALSGLKMIARERLG